MPGFNVRQSVVCHYIGEIEQVKGERLMLGLVGPTPVTKRLATEICADYQANERLMFWKRAFYSGTWQLSQYEVVKQR